MRYRYNHGKRFSRPTFGLRHGQFPHKNNRRKSTNDLIKELRKFLGMINLSLGPNAACSVLGSAAIELMDFGHTYSKAIFAAIERNDTSGLPIEMHSDGWTESNFVKKMSGLLHLEEAYQAIETRRTDVRSVRFEVIPCDWGETATACSTNSVRFDLNCSEKNTQDRCSKSVFFSCIDLSATDKQT